MNIINKLTLGFVVSGLVAWDSQLVLGYMNRLPVGNCFFIIMMFVDVKNKNSNSCFHNCKMHLNAEKKQG